MHFGFLNEMRVQRIFIFHNKKMEVLEELAEIDFELEVLEELEEIDLVHDLVRGDLLLERRQYKMFPRINMDKWDDTDFVFRFRLEKGTVAKVLGLITSSLEFPGYEQRYVLFQANN